MLNLFPIQFLAPLSYTILRLAVGCVFLYLGRAHLKNRASLQEAFTAPVLFSGAFFVWYLSIIEILIGALFVVGFLTQVAALLAMLVSLKCLSLHKVMTHPLIPQRLFYVLLFFSSFSLFITGAGALAIDLPI